MSKCPQCGYDLFPLDEVCDKCGQTVVSAVATENLITKKALSKHEKVFGAGNTAKVKGTKKKVDKDTDKAKKADKKSVNAKAAGAKNTGAKTVKGQVAPVKEQKKAAGAIKDKPAKRNYNDEIIMPDNMAKPSRKEQFDYDYEVATSERPSKSAKPEKKKSSAGKVWAIIGCVFGGIILCAGIGVLVALIILKTRGDVEYFYGGDGDYFESRDDDYWDDDEDEDDYEEWGLSDDEWDEAWDEYSDADVAPYFEDGTLEEGVEYIDSDDEPVQGEENIGKVFNIGETFTYDNVSYTATSFVKIDDDSSSRESDGFTETYSNGELVSDEDEVDEDSEDSGDSDDAESYEEEEPDETLYQLNFTVVNNASDSRDVDVMGTYYENGEESDTYTADDKDSFVSLQGGQSAELAVSVFVRKGASNGLYDLEVGMYEGDVITIKLF